MESLLGKMQLVAFSWLYIVSGMQGVEMRACCATILLTGEHANSQTVGYDMVMILRMSLVAKLRVYSRAEEI